VRAAIANVAGATNPMGECMTDRDQAAGGAVRRWKGAH
jgi:hypothetical protein